MKSPGWVKKHLDSTRSVLNGSSLWKVKRHEMFSAERGSSHTQVAFGGKGWVLFIF